MKGIGWADRVKAVEDMAGKIYVETIKRINRGALRSPRPKTINSRIFLSCQPVDPAGSKSPGSEIVIFDHHRVFYPIGTFALVLEVCGVQGARSLAQLAIFFRVGKFGNTGAKGGTEANGLPSGGLASAPGEGGILTVDGVGGGHYLGAGNFSGVHLAVCLPLLTNVDTKIYLLVYIAKFIFTNRCIYFGKG